MWHIGRIVPWLGDGKGSNPPLTLIDSPFWIGCIVDGDGAGKGSAGGALLPGWPSPLVPCPFLPITLFSSDILSSSDEKPQYIIMLVGEGRKYLK